MEIKSFSYFFIFYYNKLKYSIVRLICRWGRRKITVIIDGLPGMNILIWFRMPVGGKVKCSCAPGHECSERYYGY